VTCPTCGHAAHERGRCTGGLRACPCEFASVLATVELEPALAHALAGSVEDGRPRRPPTKRARARGGDPQTSHQAAAAFTVSQLRASQYEIYRLFSLFGPCHDEALVERARQHGVQQKESGIRTRRHELVERGLLKDSGQTVVLSDSKRESIVWCVTAPAEIARQA
jgi:hypothetical protein